MGSITRVRFEAEGRDHDDVLEALDAATALLRPFMAEAVPNYAPALGPGGAVQVPGGSQTNIAIGGLRDDDGQVIDTEFVEEVIESRVSAGNAEYGPDSGPEGAIYYVGRRVLKVVPHYFADDLRRPMR